MSPFLPYLLPDEIKIMVALSINSLLAFYTIPVIVRVANKKKLYDVPNGRTTHTTLTPRLGGISLFLSVLITSMVLINILEFPQFQYAIAGSVIIFFIGLKDDILCISPWKKLFGQLFAAGFLIFFADIRFTSFHGFFGMNQIPYLASVFFSFFIIIVIINAFNLIDGADGLGGSMAMVGLIVLGLWFYINSRMEFVVVISSTIGALGVFLLYNIWGRKNKIFLGDTGSLLLGYFLAIFVILFCEMNTQPKSLVWPIQDVPVFAFAIIMIPLFDTARVFIIRILQGKSPFGADKNHIHHYFIELGFSHRQVTGILVLVSSIIIFITFLLQHLNLYLLTSIIILAGICMTSIPAYMVNKRNYFLPWRLSKTGKKKAA
jgi:UDP-N-acetylmuramyl pentapeptide phosphotransferase/UDP-N-acetylglucosamine-1-phosphate transferase